MEQLSLIEESEIWRRSVELFEDGTKEKSKAESL